MVCQDFISTEKVKRCLLKSEKLCPISVFDSPNVTSKANEEESLTFTFGKVFSLHGRLLPNVLFIRQSINHN